MYFWQKKNTNYKLIKYQLGNSSQDTNQKKKKKKIWRLYYRVSINPKQ